MTDSFSDLWASSGPAKPQQLPLKSLVAPANGNSTNGSRRTTPDAFTMLASARSSQPTSRPITPSVAKQPAPSKPTSLNSGDAFGGLVSFGTSTSRDDGLTIAERAARTERERREQTQREQAALESQGSFWDQFEGDSKPPANSAPATKSNDTWDFEFLTPGRTHPSENQPRAAKEVGEDDILGALAKPVDEMRRNPPRPVPSPSRTPQSRSSSPPPHVIGRIVEMGFSVQQAKVALAATDTGVDVDTALEILLQNAGTEPIERYNGRERDEEVEVETERKWRRRQGPSRVTAHSPGPSAQSAPSPAQQQGLQDQADKLLAQASTIGLSMFSKANAIWKEGREKVVRVYEEQRVASAGGDVGRSTGRPRWMDEAGASLFVDEEPVYKSPARRRPPASVPAPFLTSHSVPTSHSSSKVPSRSPTPAPMARPTITASPSALASSNAHKAAGADHFKLGRFAESEGAYSSAIIALPAGHLLRVPLYNNRALTRLRTGNYKGTVEDAGEVLHIITQDLGVAWHPRREPSGESADVDLGAALGKALRRRAEAQEGMEKWKEAMADWERLNATTWMDPTLRGDAVKGAGRCRRMLSSTSTSGSVPATSRRTMPRPKPAAVASRPSEALSRVRDANAAQEAEDQARHDLKDSVDARLATWRAGKETNLRALIASLDTVLWPELGWQKVGMAELVSPGQVKVRYTKAISKLHPDKLNINNTDLEQRMIANGVFGTLNEAWNDFR